MKRRSAGCLPALAVLVAFFVSSLVMVSEVRTMSPGTVPQAQLSENPDETSPGQNLLSQSFNASLMNATHMNTKLQISGSLDQALYGGR